MPYSDSEKQKEWHRRNKERRAEKDRLDRQNNPEKYAEQERRRYARDAEKRKAYQKSLREDSEMREKLNESSRKYYHSNKNKISEKVREKRIANHDQVLEYEYNYQLNRKYGMTLQDYNSMLEAQNNKCKICNILNDESRLVVDHNHATGKVRGLLCNKCNTALGLFNDSIDILKNAIDYLNSEEN